MRPLGNKWRKTGNSYPKRAAARCHSRARDDAIQFLTCPCHLRGSATWFDARGSMAEFKKRLRRWFPTAQTLEQMQGFAWLGHYLRVHPRLWVLHRRGVALGVALGVGIGVFPLPLQMPAPVVGHVEGHGHAQPAGLVAERRR